MYEGKTEVLFFYFVPDTIRDHSTIFNITAMKYWFYIAYDVEWFIVVATPLDWQ
jgi:hypothetical protein